MQTTIYSENHKDDISLAQEFQKNLSNKSHKNGVIDQGNYRKWESKFKCIEQEYNLQEYNDVTH